MSINRGVWSEAEHDRFLEAIQIYPNGPWRFVAKHVATRDSRQVQTHAQKYYEKISRHLRGLRKERRASARAEHRIDDGTSSSAQHGDVWDHKTMVDYGSTIVNHEDSALSQEYVSLGGITEAELPSLEEALDILLQCLADDVA